MVHASCLVVHGSWFMVHASCLVARGSWFMLRASCFVFCVLCFVLRSSRFVVRSSWFVLVKRLNGFQWRNGLIKQTPQSNSNWGALCHSTRSTFTAHILNSGIRLVGSKASFVNTLIECSSPQWKGTKTVRG